MSDKTEQIIQLSKEVHELRAWLSKIEAAVWPTPEAVAGRIQYPLPIDPVSDMCRRMRKVELLLACYRNKEKIKDD